MPGHDHHHGGDTHDDEHDLLGDRPDAEIWDERYGGDGGDGQMWSGHPNATLVTEVDGMAPGTALDVCCGEGADALWLAEQGWTVTGVDVSPVAIARARAEANRRGLSIDWHIADLVTDPLDAGPFDLVTAHYPALRKTGDGLATRTLLDAVAPGGTLLVVHHDMASCAPDERRYDPADFVQPADVAAALDDRWTVEIDERRDHAAPPSHDGHHHGPGVPDLVLRARRS